MDNKCEDTAAKICKQATDEIARFIENLSEEELATWKKNISELMYRTFYK